MKRFAITQEIPIIKVSITALVVNILAILIVLLLDDKIPPQVPLYYGRPEGDLQLAPGTSLVIPPLISLVVIIINNALCLLIGSEYLKKILSFTAILITLFSFITTIKIILLVGSF